MQPPQPNIVADSRTEATSKWQSVLQLIRFDKPVGTGLVLWPALWGLVAASPEPPSLLLFAIFIAGAFLMRSAGCVINDMTDRDIDPHVARTRTRPLASGALSMKEALAVLTMLLIPAAAMLFILPNTAIFIGLCSLPLIAAYPWMKRISWWPQLFLGITFNLGVLIGYASRTDTITPGALLIYLGAIFWTLGYDTIYALQDREDDAQIGVKSTALRLKGYEKPALTIIYALCALCLISGIALTQFSITAMAGIALFSAHLGWQLLRLDTQNAHNAAMLFRSNNIAGLLLFALLLVEPIFF